MNKPNPNDSSFEQQRSSQRIDKICDQFEQGWIDGESPDLSDFLHHVDDQERSRLFVELLQVELEYQSNNGVAVDRHAYFARYADFRSELEEVLGFRSALESPLGVDVDSDVTGDPPEAQPIPTSIGRFRVIRELGRGGMGVVYLAEDQGLDRKIAVKLIKSDRTNSDRNRIVRFKREATLASQLNHPNILTIFEVGQHEAVIYLATEFVEGETLLDRLNGNTLSPSNAIDIAMQLISAVVVAHQNHVIHRDIKPENIMIRSDGLLKVLDFGLAKSASHRHPILAANSDLSSADSLPGTFLGTVKYMSPEQLRGQKVDCSTDIFSFGIVLSLLVTGQNPFRGATSSDTMAAILQSAPVLNMDDEDADLASLKKLILDCLEKDPARRPTASDIRHRLRTVASATQNRDREITNAATIELASESTLKGLEVRYARSGDVNIAWQTIGSGPVDLVFVMGWASHLEWIWREPSFAAFIEGLAKFSRVILFDKRGTGLSDKVPVNELPSLEHRMDDVRAVMEAAGSEKAVLCGVSEGGPLCSLFAATFPKKTLSLVMIGSYARRLQAEDYPWGPTQSQLEEFLRMIERDWGGPVGIETRAPSKANDPVFRSWWAGYLRMGASPGAAVALTRMNSQIDIRGILPDIQVPTLVLHREGDQCLLVEEGRYLAEKIPGAKFVAFPGDDHLPFVGDGDAIVQEIQTFLKDCRNPPSTDRVLATIVCVALAASEQANPLFSELAQQTVNKLRGKVMSGNANEFLAIFDGPVRAVDAAHAISDLAVAHQLSPRAALHTGACDVIESRVSGPAVQKARQISSVTPCGSVFLTDSLRNLIADLELQLVRAVVPDETESVFKSLRS